MIEYPSDWDWVWAASDAGGNLAAFITAGHGGIPKLLLEGELVDYEGALLRLPTTSDACEFEKCKIMGGFVNLSRRGIFVFDWADVHNRIETRMYHKITAPTRPLKLIDALDVLSGLKIVRLNDVTFADVDAVDVSRYLDCEFYSNN